MSRITGTLSVLTITAIMTACASTAPTPNSGPFVEAIEGTPPASNALTPHPAQPSATGTPPPGVPGQLATPTTAPLTTAGPTANPIATTAPGTIAPLATAGPTANPIVTTVPGTIAPTGTTQTPLTTSQPGATRTPLPTASLTLPPTFTPRSPTATTAPGQPSATPSPTAPPIPQPLLIRKDQGCVDTITDELYIFGEIANQSTQHYDINDIKVEVRYATGVISATDVFWDMPGDDFVPANGALPFQLIAPLEQPSYTSYSLIVDAEPGVHSPRSNLRIDSFTETPLDEDLIEVMGQWTNPGTTSLADSVSLIAVKYDTPAQGRISNMAYDDITAAAELTPGQHSFDAVYLEFSPCVGNSTAVSIIGE